jgi:hypothetical protein
MSLSALTKYKARSVCQIYIFLTICLSVSAFIDRTVAFVTDSSFSLTLNLHPNIKSVTVKNLKTWHNKHCYFFDRIYGEWLKIQFMLYILYRVSFSWQTCWILRSQNAEKDLNILNVFYH